MLGAILGTDDSTERSSPSWNPHSSEERQTPNKVNKHKVHHTVIKIKNIQYSNYVLREKRKQEGREGGWLPASLPVIKVWTVCPLQPWAHRDLAVLQLYPANTRVFASPSLSSVCSILILVFMPFKKADLQGFPTKPSLTIVVSANPAIFWGLRGPLQLQNETKYNVLIFFYFLKVIRLTVD